jgi:hypothetical protein
MPWCWLLHAATSIATIWALRYSKICLRNGKKNC